jgi:uncharacterized membrane protein (DUF485 family)
LFEFQKRDFWQPFLDKFYNLPEIQNELKNNQLEGLVYTVDQLQKGFVEDFPDALKYQLIKTFLGHEDKRSLASSLNIKVTDLHYSSLAFDLVIEPIEKLAKIFDGNFEYFLVFLSGFAPQALESAVAGVLGTNSVFGDITSALLVETRKTDKVEGEFDKVANELNKPTTNIDKPVFNASRENPPGLLDKAKVNWLWAISNTSLIIPVVLASIFIWHAWKTVVARSTELDKRYNELIMTQKQLIEIEMKYIQQLTNASDSTKKK